MATIVIMPKQGQSVETCIISSINKQRGDTVKKGDVLFSYETDKASFEEESPIDGVVLELFYNEGDEVSVLESMLIIGEPEEDYSDLLNTIKIVEEKIAKVQETDTKQSIKESTIDHANASYQISSEQQFISPRAKRLADKEALSYKNIIGTGPKGRIIEKNILSALEDRPRLTSLARRIASEEGLNPPHDGSGLAGKAKASDLSLPVNTVYGVEYEDKKISNVRKLIAKSMHSSLQNSAQLTHHLAADARRILELRKKAKAALGAGTISANITINDMVCFAVVEALKKFPNVNTHFHGDTVRYFKKVHLALAVDTDRGLMVPVIRNADDLSITGLSNQLKKVAAQIFRCEPDKLPNRRY